MPSHRLTFALAAALSLAACDKHNTTPPATPSATPSQPAPEAVDASTPAVVTVPDAPSDAMLTLRGAALKKVLDIVRNAVGPGASNRELLGGLGRMLTPGLGEQGFDVDPDAAFSALMAPRDADSPSGQVTFAVAWPLRPGTDIARRAQALQGFRETSPGVYAPTTVEGDAGADNPCWVARRAPAGWLMLCGPREVLERGARWLVGAASVRPEPQTVLDATLRPAGIRRMLALQLATLETQDPRRHDAGSNRPLVAQFDAVRASGLRYKELFDDLESLQATLSLDQDAYHLHAEGHFAHASGQGSRTLLAGFVGQQAPQDLLRQLPASTTAYYAMGVDTAALGAWAEADPPDPRMAALIGPELTRFQTALRDLVSPRRSARRVMGFVPDDAGGTKWEMVQVDDATAAVNNIRALATAVPRAPRPGVNPAEIFSVLPTPAGLPPNTLRMRLGPDPARLPPNVPAAVRQQLQRTLLLVPEGHTLHIVDAVDPQSRWRAIHEGGRLTASVPEGETVSIRLTPAAFFAIVGAPANANASAEAIVGHLTATRVGDNGGHLTAQIDGPIVAINQVRDVVIQILAQQQQMEEQQRQAQQAAMQQAQQAQRRGPARPGADSLMPRLTDPDNLPDPTLPPLRSPQ